MKYLMPKRSDIIKLPDNLSDCNFLCKFNERLYENLWCNNDPSDAKQLLSLTKFFTRIADGYYFVDASTNSWVLPVYKGHYLIDFTDLLNECPPIGYERVDFVHNRYKIHRKLEVKNLLYEYKSFDGSFWFIPKGLGDKILETGEIERVGTLSLMEMEEYYI